jgi:ribosome-associated toxin RatA of RatAB toxin-antitoxin module
MAFEHVVTDAIILGKVRKDFAWQIIKDYKRYPDMMENVDGVEIHFQGDTAGKSEWFVSIEGAPLRWVEKDFFYKDTYTIRFESIDGDFDNINGKWKIEDFEGKGIRLHFSMDYNLGIPVIEEVLGPVLKEKMQTNLDMMMAAIKNELSRAQTEERHAERFTINTYSNLQMNQKTVRALILNISCGGMQFFTDSRFDELYTDLQLKPLNIKADVSYNDARHQHVRLIFKNKLNRQELQTMLTCLRSGPIRKNPRVAIDKKVKIELDGEVLNVYLVDLSRQGLCFRYNGEKKPLGDAITLLDKTISVNAKWPGKDQKQMRVLFADELSEKDLQDMIRKLG